MSTISNYISPAFVTGEMDCYRACVASILGLPVRDVPNFYIRASGTGLTEQEHSIHMRKDARKYLSSLGLGIFETYCNGEWPIERVIAWASADNPGCPIILNGKPAHSHEESHAVVLLDGAVAHDPSGAGISGPLMSSDGHSWWFLEIIAVTAARGSGNYISSVDAEAVWGEAQRVYVNCPFGDMDAPDDMAVKVISDALDKARAEGREEERARIVAWLLDDDTRLTYEEQPKLEREHEFWWAADQIEQGAPGASR